MSAISCQNQVDHAKNRLSLNPIKILCHILRKFDFNDIKILISDKFELYFRRKINLLRSLEPDKNKINLLGPLLS